MYTQVTMDCGCMFVVMMDSYYIIYPTWKLSTLWPLTAIDITLYTFLIVFWTIVCYQCSFIKQFYQLRTKYYFKARLPHLLICVVLLLTFVAVVIWPFNWLSSIKTTQHNWEYPPIVRVVNYTAFMFGATFGLVYIWFILYEFKFQQSVFRLNIATSISYSCDPSESREISSRSDDRDPKKDYADVLNLHSNIDDDNGAFKLPTSFWLEQKQKFWGVPHKVILFVAVPYICTYSLVLFLLNIYTNPRLLIVFNIVCLLSLVVCFIICGKSISLHNDSVFLRGMYCTVCFN